MGMGMGTEANQVETTADLGTCRREEIREAREMPSV
jgi:hypothetical protein